MSGNVKSLCFTEYHCHTQLDALQGRWCYSEASLYYTYIHKHTLVQPLFLQAGVPWKEMNTTAMKRKRL
jgi:hypothetical protein